jgi:hypothetical protein
MSEKKDTPAPFVASFPFSGSNASAAPTPSARYAILRNEIPYVEKELEQLRMAWLRTDNNSDEGKALLVRYKTLYDTYETMTTDLSNLSGQLGNK